MAAFKRAGFYIKKTKGDHVSLWHDDRNMVRPVIVPLKKELPEFIVANNMRTAKLSRKDYLAYLRGAKKREP